MDVASVTARLAHFGYTVVEGDVSEIEYDIAKVDNYIKSFCNVAELPAALEQVATDRVAAEFLRSKKFSGAAALGLTPSGEIKSITEGDTSITYGDGTTAEGRLDTLIDRWLSDSALLPFRRLRW